MTDESTPTAKLLKVALADDESGQIHARQVDGRYLWFTVTGAMPEKGDIILLYDGRWEHAPHELWPVHNRAIAIVRHITKDGNVVIEEGVSLRQVANPLDLPVTVGNTVEMDDDGVAAIISDTPIRSQHFDREPADIEKEFRVSTDGNGPGFADFGGYPGVVERARKLIDTQMLRQDELRTIGARPVKGVLFTGPPGTGKTHLARIIVQESGADFYLVSGPTVVSKWVGDSEETLRRIFDAAAASAGGRAIIFFDEIDSIAERRSGDSRRVRWRLSASPSISPIGRIYAASCSLMLNSPSSAASLEQVSKTSGPQLSWAIYLGSSHLTSTSRSRPRARYLLAALAVGQA